MKKKAMKNREVRTCQNCKNDFNIEPEDFSFYIKLGVPPPTWCPHCRFIRKLTFVNERSLYKGICAKCKSFMISMYHPENQMTVWCVKCHIGDSWDARDYAREYDFSQNFFKQFKELKSKVPRRNLGQNERNGAGCEYSNHCFTSKNIYLSFQVATSENIKYSRHVFKYNKNCMDSLSIKSNERGYELVKSSSNYNSSFLVDSSQCVESNFLYDCSNCINCFMSANLRNKSYVFRGQQLSREEYMEAMESLALHTYSSQLRAKDEFNKLYKKSIHKHADIKNSENAVGDFIENSKNVSNSYGLVGAENVKNIFIAANIIEDCQDMVFVGKLSECYEMVDGGRGGNKIVFCLGCGGGCKNLLYCDNCKGCSDCFGCVGLNKKQYCIFNKQFSKEEYLETIEKIKKQMDEVPYIDAKGRKYTFGEFFPTELSHFAYNETDAFEEEPLSEAQVLEAGYEWREPESKNYVTTLESNSLVDSINDIEDSICNETIACPNKGRVETLCTSAFKILPDELVFYRQMKLPLPRFCPNCRYYERMAYQNPFRFYKRQCMCSSLDSPSTTVDHNHEGECMNEFETMYSPNRAEIIYCKECYQKEVY